MNSSATITAAVPTTIGLVFQPNAAEFCNTHKLHPLVKFAARLSTEHFALAGPIEVELETDPNSDEQRPILNLHVHGGVDEVEEQYQAYTRDWVRQVPVDSLLSVGKFLNLVGNSDASM